jgi:hypothetical protein
VSREDRANADADGNPGTRADPESDATNRAVDGVSTVVAPDVARATRFLQRVVDEDRYVTVVGDCTVEYSGRAASTLGPGRRHVVRKPDETVLVHEADGQKPVNWQSPGGNVTVFEGRREDADSERTGERADSEHASEDADEQSHERCEKGVVVLRATTENPVEELVVRFSTVAQASAFEMGASSSPKTTGTEADLKEHVLADPDAIERGLQPLATERETPAGPVDVYAEDESGRPVVVELKRARVGPDAVGQLSRYVDALARDLHAGANPRGVLVAPSITDRARQLLAEDGLEYARVEPPRED